ncbi:MAG: DUF3299 domain-containing protein [Pseudomonadales bacterium]|nr:DUF3299 domain-containing protein [Pseudomonadales bacterium]
MIPKYQHILTQCLSFIAITLCLSSSLALANNEYTSIEWQQLRAEDWIPPIIQPAPSKDHEHPPVDQASLVSKLDQKNIKIPGYLIPVTFTDNIVSEFILVPFLEEHVKTHMHHEANQMIYVKLNKGFTVTNRYQPIWVQGKLSLQSQHSDEGLTGYTLTQASAEPYKY